jgi:hypothetical protein
MAAALQYDGFFSGFLPRTPASSYRFVRAGLKKSAIPENARRQSAVQFLSQFRRMTFAAPEVSYRRGPSSMVVPAYLLHSAVQNKQAAALQAVRKQMAWGQTAAADSAPSAPKTGGKGIKVAVASFKSLMRGFWRTFWQPSANSHYPGASGYGRSKWEDDPEP